MRKQNDSRGNEYIYSYDKLNQKTQQTLNGQLDASWVYSSSVPGLLEKRFKANFNESYEYDTKHRIKQVSTQLNALAARQFKYTYDAAGRTQNTIYPSGFEVNALYNPSGFLTAYQNPKTQKNYWQAEDMDAFGNWTGERFGNDIQVQRNYDLASGLLKTITSTKTANGDVQNLSYAWDTSGNLHSRSDANLSTSETFNYDGVNRLTSAITTGLASGDRTLSYAYDALGNMTHKSDLSDVNGMAYGTQNGTGANAGPSRLLSVTKNSALLFSYQYDVNGNMTKRGNVNAAYTAANKPSRIWSGSPQIAGYVENSFLYDTDEQRFYQQQKQGFNTVRETYYYGAGYEEIFDLDPDTQVKTHKQKAYVGGVMIHSFTQSDALVNGGKITDIQYLHHDHLGSTQTITNASGEVLQNLAFDPFGKARQSNWEDAQTSPSKTPDWASIALNHTSQGFTGHEMLADFDLIHMGGRLYDPIAGRMMSADPFIQAPYFGQSHNRYSYVWNNPLSLNDPTGFRVELTPSEMESANIQSQFNEINRLSFIVFDATVDVILGTRGQDVSEFRSESYINISTSNKDYIHASLSACAYSDSCRNSGVNGYQPVLDGRSVGLNKTQYDTDYGFSATLFSKDKSYVLAFAGTNEFWADADDNIANSFMGDSEQLRKAIDIGGEVDVATSLSRDSLVFTGHSLGGGLASGAAIMNNVSAVTFNAAGMNFDRGILKGKHDSANRLITAYYSSSDLLSVFQDFTPAIPSAAGNRILVPYGGFHGIGGMCKAMGGSCDY